MYSPARPEAYPKNVPGTTPVQEPHGEISVVLTETISTNVVELIIGRSPTQLDCHLPRDKKNS